MKKDRKKDNKKHRIRKWISKNKILVISAVIIILILVIAFGAKIWLYLNFVLGNDIIVSLDANKEDFSLARGEEEKIIFNAKVTTNPFCTAACTSKFEDISNLDTIEQDEFTLRPGIPIKKEYSIKTDKLGEGQLLYRFSMECSSKKTILCQTKDEKTSREILITVRYKLSENEKNLRDSLKDSLKSLAEETGRISAKEKRISYLIEKTGILDEYKKDNNNIKLSISGQIEKISSLKELWDNQDYYLLKEKYDETIKEHSVAEQGLNKLDSKISGTILEYNNIVRNIIKTNKYLEELRKTFILNISQKKAISPNIEEFNSIVDFILQNNSLQQKKAAADYISNITENIYQEIIKDIAENSIRRDIETNTQYDILCSLNGTCFNHLSIEEIATKDKSDLKSSCKDIDNLKEYYAGINESIINASLNENYPNDKEFSDNISIILDNMKQEIINNYLKAVPENAVNTLFIRNILTRKNITKTAEYPAYNLTPALLLELMNHPPLTCKYTEINISSIKKTNLSMIETNITFSDELNLKFEIPEPECCVFSKCKKCCEGTACSDNPATFPILFLNGHAFNKDTPWDYSLDAFNKIQKKLEKDGYIDAGAISLYTPKNVEPGTWGVSGVPVSVKISYYFDIFHEPENYIFVQTKSENIDTYAVRLKELLDMIQFKTGKDKAIIITHSMGGLVTRRYMQIFGSDKIEKLIMVSTPNKGIRGDIADYCPITGDKLECSDMNADSLLINKLNRASIPNINIYNIIGTGCKMKEGIGDGVVLEDDAKVDGTKNYIVKGSCNGLNILHTQILDIDKYPEVYSIIKEAVKQ